MAKPVKEVTITATLPFSYASPGKNGPINNTVSPGDVLTVDSHDATNWCKRQLAVEGKVAVAKKAAKTVS